MVKMVRMDKMDKMDKLDKITIYSVMCLLLLNSGKSHRFCIVFPPLFIRDL